jgi:hypothetical protein
MALSSSAEAAMPLLLALLCWLLVVTPARAGEPIYAFEADGTRGVPTEFQRWHPEYEADGNYGESWFYVARTADGGALFFMMAVTNLGLRTFDGSVDVQYYAPDGRKWNLHHEYHREQIQGAADRMDMTIGKAHTWGGGGTYRVTLAEADVSLDLTLVNELPSYKFGNGKLFFGADRAQQYTIGMNAPRARTSGSVSFGGTRFDLAGYGYTDHGWATIKMPSFIKLWYAVRMFDERYTLVLHRQLLQPRYGGDNKFGLLGVDGKIVAPSRNFRLDATQTRPEAGLSLPTELTVSMNSGGYQVTGTIRELRYQESIDVLGRISLPVRMAIKAFYTNPYFLRYMGQCELDVTHEGVTEHVSHECLVEIDYY